MSELETDAQELIARFHDLWKSVGDYSVIIDPTEDDNGKFLEDLFKLHLHLMKYPTNDTIPAEFYESVKKSILRGLGNKEIQDGVANTILGPITRALLKHAEQIEATSKVPDGIAVSAVKRIIANAKKIRGAAVAATVVRGAKTLEVRRETQQRQRVERAVAAAVPVQNNNKNEGNQTVTKPPDASIDDNVPLPNGWIRVSDDEGDVWYKNEKEGKSQWERPLPEGWIRFSDDEGDVWYENAKEGKSQWKIPQEGAKRRRKTRRRHPRRKTSRRKQ